MTKQAEPIGSPPWWRVPSVWLVIGLPASVVLASLASAWIAVHTSDTVVEEDYYRKGIEINRTIADKALVPALTGRNHAVTPATDMPVRPRATP